MTKSEACSVMIAGDAWLPNLHFDIRYSVFDIRYFQATPARRI